MFDSWESIIALVAAILIAYAVILWLGTIVWTYRDMRERTRDGWSQAVAVLLVVLFNIPGLFLYLILRPHETLTEAYERRLEAEALMRDLPEQRPSCPICARMVNEAYLLCPYCCTKLREPCSGCGRALELGWIVCPYCGAQGPQNDVAAKAPMAAGRPTAAAAQPSPRSTEQAPQAAGAGTSRERTSGGSAPERASAASQASPPEAGAS